MDYQRWGPDDWSLRVMTLNSWNFSWLINLAMTQLERTPHPKDSRRAYALSIFDRPGNAGWNIWEMNFPLIGIAAKVPIIAP